MACSGRQSILRWTNHGDGVAWHHWSRKALSLGYAIAVHRSATSSHLSWSVGAHPSIASLKFASAYLFVFYTRSCAIVGIVGTMSSPDPRRGISQEPDKSDPLRK
jgi:hypothetical protein